MLKANYQYHQLQFKKPSGTSRGILHTKDSWFIRIWDDKNPERIGIGECSLIPNLSPDDTETLQSKMEEVCENISDYFYWLNGGLQDYPALQFAVETALLDLQKGGQRILFPSAFTRGEKAIPINGLLWMGDADFIHEQLTEKIAQGFRCIKMKVGAIDTVEERKLLQFIREKYPECTLRIDANGAFSTAEVAEHLAFFANLGIHSIEQPIRQGQWSAMKEICKNSPLPIALDEELIGVVGREQKSKLLEIIKPHYIILKPSLLGGFKASEEWIALAEERQIGWWITSALESNIGLNAIAQWTETLGNPTYQGLGTGSLYTNNVASPLEVLGEELWYNPKKIVGMLLDFCRYEYPEQYCVPETDFDKEVLAFLQRWRAEQHFSIQTSGSTGTPKTITHSKTAMQNSAKLTGDYFNFKQGQKALLCLPIHKIAGIMMLVRAMVWKMQLYTVPPKLKLDLSNLPTLDFAPLLPTQAIQSFDELPKIRTILLGGASLPQQLLMQIKGHSSQFFHSYGMTETISHIAICDLQKNVNIYSVLPEITISVNTENCLRIDASILEVENLQTNDIVELLTKKSFRFLGRIDSVINSGGLKIIAEEVERQLSNYISQPFYIAGTPDEELGEKVTLFIEGEAWKEYKIKELKEQFQKIVPKQAIPRTIIFQEKFTYTETGKVKR